MDQFGIDGFRFDEVSDFYRKDMPARGLPRLLADLHDHLAAGGQRNFSLILEDDWDFSAINDTDAVHATNCWFDMLRARAFDYLRPGGRVDTRFLRVLNSAKDFAPDKGPVMYLENHDHSSITWIAGGRDRCYRVQPYLIALFTCPGALLTRIRRDHPALRSSHFYPDT
jgi:pullulanase